MNASWKLLLLCWDPAGIQRKVGTGWVWTIEVVLPSLCIRNSKRAGLVESAMLLSLIVSSRDCKSNSLL